MIDLGAIASRTRWLGVVALSLACLWVALDTRSCWGQHQEAQHVQVADQQHQAAVTAAAQGAAYDQVAKDHEQQLQDAAAQVARLRAEVARLRQAPPPSHPGDTVPASNPDPQPVVPGVDLAAVVAKQDQLIAAQDRQIQEQGEQIRVLTLDRNAWRTSAQASAQEAVQVRAALAAREGAARAERWKGRIEGLAVGLGLGYAGGKL